MMHKKQKRDWQTMLRILPFVTIRFLQRMDIVKLCLKNTIFSWYIEFAGRKLLLKLCIMNYRILGPYLHRKKINKFLILY